ncbi:MAG: hypothetical protein JWN10_1456, partial [Solirubrobacterales bacterium]|nr:hypothetical protein [Solirubrobacterales bacterium]
ITPLHQPTGEQFYLFPMPGDACPIWCESFGAFGHVVAPTPFASLEQGMTVLDGMHPGAVVDTLDDPAEIATARALGAA